MRRKNEIKNAVAFILWQDELARKDDCYLIMRVIQEIEPELAGETFANVMTNAKYKGSSSESITRARRKYMSQHPELKDKETEKARREEEETYREEYSGGYTC